MAGEIVPFDSSFTKRSSCFTLEQAEPAVLSYVVFEFNVIGRRMSGSSPPLEIDNTHFRAICDEIGYRLGQAWQRENPRLPPKLEFLLERLHRQEADTAPSIAPSLDELLPLAHVRR
jgi:hypothetical protein